MVLRAISDDYTASWSVGISVERGVALSWALSSMVATAAGVLWGSIQGVDQSLSLLLLKGITVAVLGGLDSLGGAILAGIGLGALEAVAAGVLDPLAGRRHARTGGGAGADPHHHDPPARPVRPPRHRKAVAMLFRQAGIRHTDYAADRALFPIPADRVMIGALLLFAAVAPLIVSSLALSSYLTPWLVWTSAALGLNLILGWAGQFHFGYAAIMGIGAYATVHGVRNGIPWEIAIVLGGLTATVVGIVFAFAALRVKGLYLALSTLALQFVMDWVISHVPAISGGVGATLQAPAMRLLGQPVQSECGAVLRCAGLVPAGDDVHAEPAPHRARPRAGGGAREGLRRRGHRRAELPLQAGGVRDLVLHRRRQRRGADLHLLSRGDARAVRGQRLDRAAGDGHRRRPGQHHRQLVRRRVHPAACRGRSTR